jgi:hypothetical protein
MVRSVPDTSRRRRPSLRITCDLKIAVDVPAGGTWAFERAVVAGTNVAWKDV